MPCWQKTDKYISTIASIPYAARFANGIGRYCWCNAFEKIVDKIVQSQLNGKILENGFMFWARVSL